METDGLRRGEASLESVSRTMDILRRGPPEMADAQDFASKVTKASG